MINIFEPKKESLGAEITISSSQSRKSFHLKRPPDHKAKSPLAIESFAIDPNEYFEYMKKVEALHKHKR